MPIDFTKSTVKTNAEYLKKSIEKYIQPDKRQEAIEWLEGLLHDHQKVVNALKDEVIEANEEKVAAQNELQEIEDYDDLHETIDTGLYSHASGQGDLKWRCDNIAIQGLMETFVEKLEKHGHIRLETLLNSLA